MAKSASSHFFKIAGMGMLSGIRTLSGPALVAPFLSSPAKRFFRTGFFRPSNAARYPNILQAMALGEMILDKLPIAPDRISRWPLAGRAMAGMFTGAMTSRVLGKREIPSLLMGAATGGIGAIAGAYAGFHLRSWLRRKDILPDFMLGLIEDVAVTQLGGKILARAA